MLLDNNTKNVVKMINYFDKLNDEDKLRLAIHLLENKNFYTNFNIRDILILLKDIMRRLNTNYDNNIINYNKYKNLLILSAKYLELDDIEKKHFSIEMLFNIYENKFKDDNINLLINENLLIYDFSYNLLNK